MNPKAKERTGYPTQKPIELLERIVKISTKTGDCILDPFCGSGTTLVAALMMDRRYIGIDINPDAIEICRKRLQKPSKTESNLLKSASASKKCSFSILITPEKDWENMCVSVPANMIVLNNYSSAFERMILETDKAIAM